MSSPGLVDVAAPDATVEVAHPAGGTVTAFRDRHRTLTALVAQAARRWPLRTALTSDEAVVTYAGLPTLVDTVAAALRARGVEPGDRVGSALPHGLLPVLLPLIADRLGCAVAPLDVHATPDRWATQLTRVHATHLLTPTNPHLALPHDHDVTLLDAAEITAVLGVPAPRPGGGLVGFPARRPGGGPAAPAGRGTLSGGPAAEDRDGAPGPQAAADEDRPVALLTTSGTTGEPKTTVVTTRGLVHAALAYVDLLGLRADRPETSLVVLPLHSIGWMSAQLATMLMVGGALVVPTDPSPAGAAARMATHDVTHLDAVPAWLAGMVRADDGRSLPAWRTLIYGGAPMPTGTVAALARRHPGLVCTDVWGLSETHGPATAQRFDPLDPPAAGQVGRPLCGVEVLAAPVVGDDVDPGRPVSLPPGTVGELCVRGPNVTPGYLDDPEANRRVLSGGWLRTGDLGLVDADGVVHLRDRAKDVILRGGANVFSVEVEQVLCSDRAVAEAAVWGVADPVGGEAVQAAVVAAPNATVDAAALRRLVAGRIGVHAAPRQISLVTSLPRNVTGKVDKRRLREEHR